MNKMLRSVALMGAGLVALGACDEPRAAKAADLAAVCEVDITYCEP